MSTGSNTIGAWLGTLLTRLAAGATPIDGTHAASTATLRDAPPRPAARSRHFAASCELGAASGQTQFVRGLC